MDAILANPNIGQFKYEQTYTNADGGSDKRDMYDVGVLRKEFAKADPWSAILTSSTESNAAWEWLNGMNQKFEGLEGEWYGNEMKTDGSGEYTDRAKKQREFLKGALTEYTINTNIPADQKGDKFNILRSTSIKEKTPEKPTGTGGLGDKNSADYTGLIDINKEWEKAVIGSKGTSQGPSSVSLKEKQQELSKKSILNMEKYLTDKYRNRPYDGKAIVDFKVEMVDPSDPKKGLHFKPYYMVEQEEKRLNEDTGEFEPVLSNTGNPVMIKGKQGASEWFDVNNMDQLTTFENNIKKQTQGINTEKESAY